jgi:outer membrane protein TolC
MSVLLLLILPAQTLTLEQAVTQALEQHQMRVALAERQGAARAGQTQAALKPNPTLYLQSENTRFWGAPRFSYPEASDTFAYLGQVIETGGKRLRRVDLAKEQTARAAIDRELFDRQLKLRVRQAYWGASAAAYIAEFAGRQSSTFQTLIENNRLRVREGVLAEGDLIRSEIEWNRLQAIAEQAAADARRARVLLFREMGAREVNDAVTLVTELEGDLPAGAPELPVEPVRRLEYQRAQQDRQVAQANLRLQKANAVPDPQLLYGYKRSAGFDTLLGGVIVDLPLRSRNQGRIAAAEADRRAAEAEARMWQAQIEAEVRAAGIDYAVRRQLLSTTLGQMRARATETLRLTRAAYSEGGLELLRLIDAERAYLDAEIQYARAWGELRQARAALDYALGVDQ